MSTIVAIATALGAGGIGIVRLSGEDALATAKNIFAVQHSAANKSADQALSYEFGSEPAKMIFGEIVCSDFRDRGYAVYFKAPRSFTGEDVVEFHLHGGVRILDGVVRECIKFGAVQAERGEFTKRAFLNGKMSLADAEGVVDMINAESASAIRAAYKLLDGEFGKKIKAIEEKLLDLMSGLEASLDYPDEMEDEVLPEAPSVVGELKDEIDKLLLTADVGRIAKNGVTVVLVGLTNVGKSSLLNAVLKRERAIVTDIAGTTRDVVSESFEYKGVKFNLVDTAGIRDSADEIERIGVKKTESEILNADAVIYVTDASEGKMSDEDEQQRVKIENLIKNKTVFYVENKNDKTGADYTASGNRFRISAKYNKGVDALLDAVYGKFKSGGLESGEVVTSERHISALTRAKASLVSAENCVRNSSTDCLLVDLQDAAQALGEITGTTASEEIVNKIFNRFCVGK